MRKITALQILTFSALFGLALTLSILTTSLLLGSLPLGDFRGVILVIAGVITLYLYLFLVYRIFLWLTPLTEGEITEHSREEFVMHVDTLFYVIFFYPIIRTYFLPTPLMRVIYQALGARLGVNTYSGGAILDPPLTDIGANTIIGHDAVLFSHSIEGSRLALARITIGNNVTIGAKATVMAGVYIGDGAIVSAGAVVTEGIQIGAGEVWGGIPARCLKRP